MHSLEDRTTVSQEAVRPDNTACEGFLGWVKNELFYGRLWTEVSVEEVLGRLNNYLYWYNERSIKVSLGRRRPMEYRQALGYVWSPRRRPHLHIEIH